MKKYDRELRKWIDAEEYDKRMNKRSPDICRGKKPHDFVLVLPWFTEYTTDYKFNPDEYYKLCDERLVYLETMKERMKQIGVIDRCWFGAKERRLYMCSFCKKRKYEDQ